MTEENQETEFPEKKAPIERIGENVDILQTKLEQAIREYGGLNKRIQDVNSKIDRIMYDLDNPKREYGHTPTRQLAEMAYKQSMGFLSTENLEQHKVITDLYESINKEISKRERNNLRLTQRIDNIPEPKNMHDLLSNNWHFKELQDDVKNLIGRISELNRQDQNLAELQESLAKDVKTTQAQTGHYQECIDNVVAEFVRVITDAFLFIAGAFAVMGHGPVSDGIKGIISQVDKEKPQDENARTDSSEAE